MDRKVIRLFFPVAATGWAILILILTLTPGKYVPSYTLFSYDKLGHAGIFFIQAVLLMFVFRRNLRWNMRKTILAGMAISIAYGFIIEGIQDFIPGRYMDMYDAIANISGSFFAPPVFLLLNKRLRANNY